MAKWENNILGFIPKEDWLSIPFNPARPNDPVDALFGDEKTDNLVAKWQSIASQYQIPVMAQFHSFDVQSQTTLRVPVDTHNIEKGLIKVKINQSERMRALLHAGVQNDQMYDYVINDGVNLAEQVLTRTKVAKNELMATGKVTIKENGLDLTVDYGVPAEQTQFTLDLSENADIISQIQSIVDYANSIGAVINGIMTSRKNVTKMRKNAGLQVAINGNIGAGTYLRVSALEAFFAEEFGINRIVENDLTYATPRELSSGIVTQTTVRYFPENKVTFFANGIAGKLGTGLWGDAPEVDVANLMNVKGTGVSPYIAISQWTENDPAVLWTKASALFMPVLYNPNSLFIATVNDDSFTDDLTVAPETDAFDFPWTDKHASDMQSNIVIANGKVTGTLKYIEGGLSPAGPLSGSGNFIALKWSDPEANVTSLKVGLIGGHMTPQECIEDTDRNGVFKIESTSEKVVLIQSDGTNTRTQTLDLTGLTLQGDEA